MRDDEILPWIGKAVRVTLTDASIVAGTLHGDDGHGHGHKHYTVVLGPDQKGRRQGWVLIHGSALLPTLKMLPTIRLQWSRTVKRCAPSLAPRCLRPVQCHSSKGAWAVLVRASNLRLDSRTGCAGSPIPEVNPATAEALGHLPSSSPGSSSNKENAQCGAKRAASLDGVNLVRAVGLEPTQAFGPTDFRTTSAFAAALGRSIRSLDYPFTLASPLSRCCPSSLYTFPAWGAWLGIASEGFPEFGQFYSGNF